MFSKKADKNYIEDTETTPKSCLDVVFELLATTAGTSSSNSLPESVRLLESQLQVERHRLDIMRQVAEGLRKSLQNSDAYFLVQQQVLEDLSAKQGKVNKLAKHLASIMGTQDIVLSSSEVVSVLGLFCCSVYMLLCSLYLHLWRTLMPSG